VLLANVNWLASIMIGPPVRAGIVSVASALNVPAT
jgi:hypothetical protein